MNLAEATQKIFDELENARRDCLVSKGYENAIKQIYENIGMRRISTTVFLDDVFREASNEVSFDIQEYLNYWKEISVKLVDNGFEIVNFSSDRDDFSATIQPK